jgi:predicted ATPase/DNA-binding SARP family transcriptional activator
VERADGPLRVDVLGTLRVSGPDGSDLTPAGELPRRLLALLVLRRGRAVSADQAIDAMWPVAMPANPAAALQNHVFRLRRGLPVEVIESAPDGYRLDPALVVVDADELAAVLHAEASPVAVLAGLDAVLARWRGPAYPELDDLDEARTEAQRLEDLRGRARETRAEALLAVGGTDGLVAELASLAEEQPLRERPRALLMEALAATGRRAEALRVFDDFRRLLGEELGIEPSPALAARHQELLDGGAVTGWSPETRLPVPMTSLLGRDALLAGVTDLIEDERLVTLVGPGGVGKTRLLVEVGHRLLEARPDRSVVLCELSRAEAASAVDVVAAASGIDAKPGVRLVDRVAELLAATEVVLFLDNCEHVLDSVAELVEHVLGRCPRVRVVATSRERLRVPGEHVVVVPPLEAGDVTSPAVHLFVDRARAVASDFAPGDDELTRIEHVVTRLDGLPLAIELAAARMYTHDVHELAAGIEQRFELLSSGYRTSSRHGSLAAAVDWSFDLLDEEHRQTFTDLSVFIGSFDVADAAAVCGLEAATARSRLELLVERSLVTRAPGGRYVMLETLRAYGVEQLAAGNRLAAVEERHARHLVDWVDRADRRLGEPGTAALAEIDAAVPELHKALGWLLDHGDVDLAGRLVTSLFNYGFLRLRPDVLAWSERVAAADPGDRGSAAPVVWVVAAYAAWMAGDIVETGARAARALEVAERAGGKLPPQVLAIQGAHALFEGRLHESADWFLRSADRAAAIPDPEYRVFAAASAVLGLGYACDPAGVELADQLLADVGDRATPVVSYLWYCAGEAELSTDLARARSRYERALELAEVTGASFVTGLAGASKASIDARIGDPVAAASGYRELIRHWRRAGMWSTQWTVLRSIAVLLDRLGRPEDAAVLQAAVRATTAGHRIFGSDELALDELAARLRHVLGDEGYEAAVRRGARLDGDAAVDYALQVLTP